MEKRFFVLYMILAAMFIFVLFANNADLAVKGAESHTPVSTLSPTPSIAASDLVYELSAAPTPVLTAAFVTHKNGGYPDKWAYAPKDSLLDDWGMYNRECVSYAAWKVASTGRHMPTNFPSLAGGGAYSWPQSARLAGIPTGNQPRQGAVAVWYRNKGHVAYVESMNGAEVKISEFNANPPFAGRYSEKIIRASDPDIYIYF